MKTKHAGFTPGPWKCIEISVGVGRVPKWRVGAESGVSMDSPDYFKPFSVTLANESNARLIASAPELLAERDRLREQVEALRAALKLLVEQCDNVPIFQLDGGKSSVKAVRLAGKFSGAMNQARAALERTKQ